MEDEAPPPIVYTRARRGGVACLFMFSGPSGSGKTVSALRLATGLACGGPIGFCDTEHGRALYYAPVEDEPADPPHTFDFVHYELKEPFAPVRFEQAAVTSQRAEHAVWICDSFSHEHVGPGGLLDMHEAELQRMVPDGNFAKREAVKMAGWIKPKGQHKHLVQRMWQLNCHIILCCHADKKIELVKEYDEKKRREVTKPIDRGFVPICGGDIPYAMTASFLFSPERPGVPIWLKRFDKIGPLIDMTRPIDEDTGRRIAAWARGEKVQPLRQSQQASATRASVESKPPAAAPGQPETESRPSTAEVPQEDTAPGKNEAVLQELITRFCATQTRADHMAIVDEKEQRDRIQWFKRNKGEMYTRLNQAISESWKRTGAKEHAA